MKLRNKKTGEIVEIVAHRAGDYRDKFGSLAELNEEWEDYEEPKEYWYIDYNATVKCFQYLDYDWQEEMKSIGNYFETKEEADKVVEKLKAWKRLKDKGFRFKGCDDYHIDYELTGRCVWTDETEKDLDLLFGGEE